MNKYSSHKWIRSVINSCTDEVQLNNCRKLIDNFQSLYDDKVLSNDLEMLIVSKLMNIPILNYFTKQRENYGN